MDKSYLRSYYVFNILPSNKIENITITNKQIKLVYISIPMNFEVIESENQLVFSKTNDQNLMKSLVDITNNEKFYDDTAKMSPEYIFQFYGEISKRSKSGNESLLPLAHYLSEHFKDKIDQYDNMSNDGKITFDNLEKVFVKDSKFITYSCGQIVGAIIHSSKYEKNMFGGKDLIITGLIVTTDGKTFTQTKKRFSIGGFNGLKQVNELQIRPMTDEEHKQLTERGNKFIKYGLGTHYLSYNGKMFKESSWSGIEYFNATGRVMVDAISFKNNNSNYDNSYSQENIQMTSSLEDLRFTTWPFLQGFSFVSKQWGEMNIDKLSEINYDDNAFDYLVLDPDYKEMAKALVTNVNISFSDIIQGKSGGCIFLLHGPPGTGKTLTCETISELLHKPLYSVTIGELGTTCDVLEQKLSNILQIANSWDAVILIDEADIFLEKRTENDIERNAMVGIFLRLLERHQGVLFLTTNRVESLDDAFRSRISIIIKYNDLDKKTRTQVWKNLLHAASVSIDDTTIDSLSEITTADGKQINGRQIKNAIRMAQCITHSKKESITLNHLEKVIKMM